MTGPVAPSLFLKMNKVMSVTVERLRVAVSLNTGATVAQALKLDWFEDHVYGLSTEVLAQKIADETVTESKNVIFEYPRSTWQMFKRTHSNTWWLGWLARWRPVQMGTYIQKVTLTARWKGYAKFPNSNIVIRDERLGDPVYFLQSSGVIS